MFTKSSLNHSVSAANILGATQLDTLPSILDTGEAVDHPWCGAGYWGGDGVALPSVGARVGAGVNRMLTHTAVCPSATLLESHIDLPVWGGTLDLTTISLTEQVLV